MIAKKGLFATLSGSLILLMNYVILVSAVVLIVLILLQVRDGGLNVAATSTLQAPVERRGPAKTLHTTTILVSLVFVGACIASFLA
jgi:protein translocase SecG subunit